MLLYGVGRTSFTPQIRRHSSAGQSARFTSVRSWVQVPLSPPKEKGTERCLFLLVERHLAQPNAACCGRDFRLRLPALALCEGGNPDGFPLTLLFPSDPLGLRAASLRSKLVSLPGLCPGNASFPHTRPLPSLGGGSCAPLQELTFAALDELSSTSGTIVRTIRKPRPLWAHQRRGWVLSFPRTGKPLTAKPRPSGGDSCTSLQERIFVAHANPPPPR